VELGVALVDPDSGELLAYRRAVGPGELRVYRPDRPLGEWLVDKRRQADVLDYLARIAYTAAPDDERLHEAAEDIPPSEYEAENYRFEYQGRQHPNAGRHLNKPPTDPGRSKKVL
jgi:hypothetical protein